MEQELIDKISNSGIRKSTIEAELKIPKNSLSGMISGTRPTPPKWVKALTEYLDSQKMQVGACGADPKDPAFILSNKEAETSPIITGFDVNMTAEEHGSWMYVKYYCKEAGITIEELIAFHKSKGVTKLNVSEIAQKHAEKQRQMSKFDEERRLKKNGF